MADAKPLAYILAYDIAKDPKRLIRVHRIVREYGIPLQYSVFILHLSRRALLQLLEELRQEIDEAIDDIRVYPLSRKPEIIHYGRHSLPAGFHLLGPNAPIFFR
jgi:CRISPR-associated protein Cas2